MEGGNLDKTVSTELRKPFEKGVVRERVLRYINAPNADKGEFGPTSKAVMASYVTARAVMDRLDEVVGFGEWAFEFEPLPGNLAKGRLTVRGVVYSDVGYPNGPKDPEPLKSAVSDALKRCAVYAGVGRYLYEEETTLVNVDAAGRPIRREAQPARQPEKREEKKEEKKEEKREEKKGEAPTPVPAVETPSTKAQGLYINSLLEKRGVATKEDKGRFLSEKFGVERLEDLSMARAKEIIDQLKV